MRFSWGRALTIAAREYLTTVRRTAFVLTLVLTPLGYALLMFIMIRPQVDQALRAIRSLERMAVVDSSGALDRGATELRTVFTPERMPFGARGGPAAEPQVIRTEVRFFDDAPQAFAALERGEVQQVLVAPPDFLATGAIRRYAESSNVFTGSGVERLVQRWVARALLHGRVDSLRIERATRPGLGMALYTKDAATGAWSVHDESRELMGFLLPFMCSFLIGLSVVVGGQYLLQGVSEEKESRILESMLTTVTPDDLVVGKLIGLGGAGLTLVLSWVAMGAAASGPALLAMGVSLSPALVGLMIVYFLLGYLFYASLMTGIGAVTSNLREAQQFAFVFTFMNFIPFYLISTIIGSPGSPVALGMSLFPPTAPVTMTLRLASQDAAVPAWQIALSIALLLGSAWIALRLAARVFRIGLLLYGKTPTLPEIARWIRHA
uniref:ABC transporter permease n=1 Tax=Eiseniibacteriota bacterium TaxID=2212470 RepID=A0A832I394_UNCEI